VPFLGFRLKDVPLLKTFFAPTLVAAAYFILPLPRMGMAERGLGYPLAAGWTWVFLLFNMILCDLRDMDGDRRMGTRSLPVTIGPEWTLRMLAVLLGVLALLTVVVAWEAPPEKAMVWKELGAASVLYLGCLLAAARKPKQEHFYEWWVEGMLFLPALIEGANALRSRYS
jgi:4-hydroxybenzoate polyprenyltransferase